MTTLPAPEERPRGLSDLYAQLHREAQEERARGVALLYHVISGSVDALRAAETVYDTGWRKTLPDPIETPLEAATAQLAEVTRQRDEALRRLEGQHS